MPGAVESALRGVRTGVKSSCPYSNYSGTPGLSGRNIVIMDLSNFYSGETALPTVKRLANLHGCLLLVLFLPLAVAAAESDQDAAGAAPSPAATPNTTPPQAGNPNTGATAVNPQTAQTITDYRRTIAALQSAHGAYAPGLGEALLGLGQAYSQAGAHGKAVETFRSGLYIDRVNAGLYTMTQMPYLEHLIEEYDRLGKLDKAGNMYSYMYWVYKRNYGDNDLRILQPIQRMQHWLHRVYERGEGSKLSLVIMQKLQAMNYKAIRILQASYGNTDPRLIEHLQQYSDANLYEAERLRKELEERQVAPTFRYCRAFELEPDRRSTLMDEYILKLISERCRNYENGKLALEHILVIHKKNHLPKGSYVRALTRLGDWEMLFERRRVALHYYSRAYQMLDKSDPQNKELAELFGRPRILTATGPLLEADAGNGDATEDAGSDVKDSGGPSAVLSLDVTSTGRPTNIKVVQSTPPDDTKIQREARRYLKDSRFRPRLEDGKPVDTVGYTVTFRQVE